jgi:hypothetical protein
LASTTAHGRQWIGTASARGQRRAEHGVERVGVGGRWRGGMAAHGERGDEAMVHAFKRWVRLTGGPSPLFDLIRFFKASASKFTNMIFRMSKNGKTFLGDQKDNEEQLSLLGPLLNPSALHAINSGTNSKLNIPRILKGFKPFWKNLINFSKFYIHMIYLNIILH